MLKALSVQNLALIEDIQVDLEAGFCAWTGETGAGKSLLLTALGLVLGDKASAELIRSGKPEARAAVVFDITDPALRGDIEAILGGPLDDDQLIVTRRIAPQGRSSAQVNGLPVPIGTLKRLGERLLSIHGQHESRDLMEPAQQRAILDEHAGLEAVLARYRAARGAHAALRDRRAELIAAADRRQREQELLRFESEELAAADPRAGECEELSREAHRLAHVEELRAATADGYRLLYEADNSVQGRLGQLARRLAPLAANLPDLAPVAADLTRLGEETRELARTLRQYSKDCEEDPERLEAVEARLALYRRLAGRFHCTPDELPARRQAIDDQLAALDRDESDLAALDGPLGAAWHELEAAAVELSRARQKAAKAFGKSAQAHLKDLGLEGARLTVVVEPAAPGADPTGASPPEDGTDHVEYLFAPNPGEPPRPLRKIASGGELSRVSLAVKSVLAGADRVPTLVFDEIDAGVGGRLGAALGRKLAQLARHHQILCVTHLPQLATHAANQWMIRKEVARGRTRTTITRLEGEDRVAEIATMLRGSTAAEGTRKEAAAMLAEATRGK